MKRFFGISLISLSVSILLLHSFVPHHHSPEEFDLQEILNNEPVKTPLDLLKIGFHLNLGTDHLKDFQLCQNIVTERKAVSKQVKKLQNVFFTELSAVDFLSTNDSAPISLQKSSTFKSIFESTFTYRGPPQLS